MIRACSKDEFVKHVDFFYALALDLTKSGYPTYCDRIHTKEDFLARRLKAFERETEEVLFFESDGIVQGLVHFFWLPEDRYLQLLCFLTNVATDQALTEFLDDIRQRFHGYDVYFGFPGENVSAVEYLKEHGFECIEDDFNNTALLDRLILAPDQNGMTRIGKENYASFETLHRQIDGDMYWNSERILADLDKWAIFVKEKDGEAQGAVYYKKDGIIDGYFEIVGVDLNGRGHQPELVEALLNAALFDAKCRGGRYMTFFCEKEYEETAKKCGFLCIGNYLCFKTRLDGSFSVF
ncbi:MAG: hypothetical protein IKS21_00995 [Oscillospiraceae bacterium]|nr:hypothetical protein [Oscillospiraceae bacterium]